MSDSVDQRECMIAEGYAPFEWVADVHICRQAFHVASGPGQDLVVGETRRIAQGGLGCQVSPAFGGKDLTERGIAVSDCSQVNANEK